jgi:hypothetical protein
MLVAKNKSTVQNSPGMITLPVFDSGSDAVLQRGLTPYDKRLSTVDWSWNKNYHDRVGDHRIISMPSDKLVVEGGKFTSDIITEHGQTLIKPIELLIRERCDKGALKNAFADTAILESYENKLHDAFEALLSPAIAYTQLTVLSEPKKVLVEPDDDIYDFEEEPRAELENTCLTFRTLIPQDVLFDAIHIAGQGHHVMIEPDEQPPILPETPQNRAQNRLKKSSAKGRLSVNEQEPKLCERALHYKRVIRDLEDLTAYPDFKKLPEHIQRSLRGIFKEVSKLPLPRESTPYKITKRKAPQGFSSTLKR